MQVANRCPRSLAILIRAVSPGLLLRLLPVIVSMVCSVRRFQAGDVTPTAFRGCDQTGAWVSGVFR